MFDKYTKEIKLLMEEQKATNEEYWRAIKKLYPDIFEDIKMGESSFPEDNIITLKSDSDNLLLRYVIDSKTIYLLGLVAKSGRLQKNDIKDLNDWIDRLILYFEEGKTLWTFPNKYSFPIISKIKKRAENSGIHVEIINQGELSMGKGKEKHEIYNSIIMKKREY